MEAISPFIVKLVTAIVLFLLFAFTNEYATGFVKGISRGLLAKVPYLGKLVRSKYFGVVVAVLLAWQVTNGFGVSLADAFDTLANIDPALLTFIDAAVIAMGANAVHDGKITLSSAD